MILRNCQAVTIDCCRTSFKSEKNNRNLHSYVRDIEKKEKEKSRISMYVLSMSILHCMSPRGMSRLMIQ